MLYASLKTSTVCARLFLILELELFYKKTAVRANFANKTVKCFAE